MKKKVFSLMMTLLLAFIGVAKADVVTIGDGTSTTYITPFNSLWGYSFVEQVYTADEIGTAGTITAISFNMRESDAAQTNSVDVFMKNVSRTQFSAVEDYEPVTASDMVFSGTVTFSPGWTTITLDTPFQYDGSSNLMIGMHEYTSGYSTRYFYYTTTTNAAITFHSDGVDPDPYNLTGYTGNKYTSSNRANIQIDITAGGGGSVSGELTVHDGNDTNGYVPVYGFYCDAYLKAEMVYPAAELSTFSGGTINAMKFYASQANVSWGAANFQVFMTEVNDATISAFAGPGTVVYEGALSIVNGEMMVNFTTPYQYNGGNLLVGVYNTVTGSYVTSTWLGETVTGASVQGYSYSGLSSISPTQRNFLPKTTFSYTTGGGGGTGDQLFAVQNGEVVETVVVGTRPNGCWMEPFRFNLRNDGPAITVTHLDFTPQEYFTVVEPEMPFPMAHSEEVEVALTTGSSTNTTWQMVAIYGAGRTARIWDIVAEPYDPAIPDVWELACEEATTFPFVEVPATAHNTTLHNDYTLPFPEIPEGVDAVYKLVFDQDQMLNAEVTAGADGKVALYTEDFFGEGGPMATNNYVGVEIGGGGASGGGFEAQIGEGTSTLTYFPFHTLWNYSLAENLFLASELTEAGVTTSPMTSLSWYVSSTSCTTPQNGISIWMGNVSDAALTGTSHTTAGMTLVYTGANILPAEGWNEFVFNEGNFAWDGHSNILILCQRQNGSWQGSVSWQTHNPGFAATCYAYTDNAPGYDATSQTYSMTTSTTNRANIIMKSDRSRLMGRDVVTEGFENGLGNWTMVDCHSNSGITTSYTPHSGSAMFGFYYTTNPPQYLISPMLNGTENGVDVSFYYESYSSYYPESFQVGYSTTTNSVSAFTFGTEITAPTEWTEYTGSFPAGTKYIAVKCTSYDEFWLFLDDFTFTTTGGGAPTPGPVVNDDYSFGPIITNMPVEAGTYYLVASSTDADFEVTINAEDMPCPQVEGFAFNPTPADDEDGVEPGSVTLRWNIPTYATGWRLIFGTTYYPDPNHPQTIMYPEDGSFSTSLANSYTVRNLWNNTNYFWRVEFNNAGACPEGVSSPIWGFTTHLNIPQNLTAVDYTVFNDEQIVLNWNPVVDRTYRMYNVYRDGQLIGNTQVNNISNTTYTDGPLAYNMAGYTYYVTAVYDEGESAPSDPVTVKVSGYGDVNGHVYEQDGTTGIAGATVTMQGLDEFNVSQTYHFTTNAQGYYSGHIYAGTYNGQAAKDGYQTIYAPVQGNPIAIDYNQTTSPIDYVLDENFDPVCTVIAEYYPDSLDPTSPYVKVYWGCGLPGEEIVEPFETGDFSLFDWQLDPTYPWVITTQNPYEGNYCMKSGNQQVLESTSIMQVTVNIPADGIMSFFGKISCESGWDYGYFYIDGVQKGSYTGESNWSEKTFEITAGDHTFKWEYTEDFIISQGDDCFYVDYITFYKRPEPAIPGMTYDFENSTMQGWTSVDADGDGYGWYVASEIMSTGYGHNGSNDCVLSQSYSNNVGVLYPDNYLVSPQVALGGVLHFYACAQDANYAAEHFGVAVSTTNTNPSSFTMLQEWTMSAKSVGPMGRPVKGSRSGRAQGNWYEYTVDLSAYSGNGYVAIRHFNCSDMFYLDVDDITIGEPGKGMANNDRSLNHYRVYRTNCYNDGPYTVDNTVLLATVWVPDTVYIDVNWPEVLPGVYKWGVGSVYEGNRGELVEGPISWSEPINVNNANRATLDYNFDDNTLQGWTNIDADGDGNVWVSSANPGIYHNSGVNLSGTGHNSSEAYVISGSYANGTGQALYPDNYLVSPQIALGGSISFYACAQDASYAAEHFGVAVSTSGNTSASSFTTLQEWTLTAKGGEGGVRSFGREGNNRVQGNWYQFTVDLSAYSGMGYVAIRHFNCTDEFILNVDDITIVEGAGGPGPGPGPNPGSNGLQLPRESEIVWSNCLDKDMYIAPADVTVLLNSADSPEGTVVTFINYNEAEQQNYPIAPITLDGSGFYAFDSFRRGAYKVTVEMEGYEPVVDSINFIDYPNNLVNEMHLRYVLTEILYGVGDVYVSRTGWAMWDGESINPTPGPGGNGDTFVMDFNNGLGNWTTIDANGDGFNWMAASAYPHESLIGMGHNSSNDFAISESYDNYTYNPITPDNYLVSPQVSIVNGSTFSFWVTAGNDTWGAEHYGVAISTSGNTNASDFTTISEWTLPAKGGAKADGQRQLNDGIWYEKTIDLSAYAGQQVYIAIRHFNCNDQWIICVDDASLTIGAKEGDRHLEYYKVMCTSIDGVPIFNHNTVWPFCQLSTDEPYNAPLVEGEHYLCKVACVYSTGMSAWSTPVEWVYEPCDHWGPVDEVSVSTQNQGNHIEWVFEHGYNPYDPGTGPTPPQPGVGDWYYYDNGVNVDAIGTGGGNFWWAVMFPAGSYQGNMVTKVSAYDYEAMSGNVTIFQGGAAVPGTAVGQTNVTFTGSNQFVEFEFAEPVTIDPTQNVWVVFYNGSGAGWPAAVCDNTGDANGRWVSLDGAVWEDLASYGLDYTFMVRAYIASGAKGDVKEVKVYEPAGQNNGTLAISGNGPRVRTITENVNFAMINESMLEFSIADIANFDARVYFLYNLVNDNRFTVVNSEENGKFIVSTDSNINLKESFADFVDQTMSSFARMDKRQAAETAHEYKNVLPMTFVNSMMMDIYVKSRDNSHCADAYPFCTDEGMYEFPAGVNAGSGETGPYYDCLYSTPNPAWYYMKMADPGDMDIHMYSTPEVDIDFCCWGPFADPTSPCPNGLTSDKVVSCSYSTSWTEHCMIPASAQTGEYYILIITNYSNQPCNINFSKVGGSGTTDCGIIPPTNVDLIGFLITQDGEYLAFAGPDDREYDDLGEYGDHVYCVRPIYPGEMTLPDHNYGWSMGCPVCEGGTGECAPGAPIYVEDLGETDQIKIWWGDQNPGPGPGGCEGDEFTVDFESGMPAGWTTIDADGDGDNWMLGSVGMGTGYGHNGSGDLILSRSYDNNSGPLTPDNWLVTPALTLCEGSTFSFYACAQDANYAAEHFGVAVSENGTDFTMVQEWTMTAKGEGKAGGLSRSGRAQGNWYQYTVNLGDYAGEGRKIAIRHFNCTDWFYLDVDDIVLTNGAKNRDAIVKYNVYRSDDNATYTMIGEVAAVAGQTYYEYIDTPEAVGTYYYQVRADYGDCESDPAVSGVDPTVNYVTGHMTGMDELDSNVNLYPNPTKGNITIEANGMSRITVVSILGQVVFDTELNANNYTLNMSQFNAGMYMVRVYTENGVTVKRVTVMQ